MWASHPSLNMDIKRVVITIRMMLPGPPRWYDPKPLVTRARWRVGSVSDFGKQGIRVEWSLSSVISIIATFRCAGLHLMEYSRVCFVTRNWDAWLTMIEHSRLCLDPIQASIKWPLMFHSWASPRVLSMLACPTLNMLIFAAALWGAAVWGG
jgi:hypothetical protein